MLRFRFISALIAILTASFLVSCEGERYATIEGFAQGGTYHVIYKLPRGRSESQIKQMVEERLTAIDNSLSGYNKGSLLSRLNAGEDLELDSLFINCFNRSFDVWEKSEGAFDPSAAPLFDLWGFGFSNKGSISQSTIDSIQQFIGMDKVRIVERGGSCFLEKDDPRIKLNFNAIAQGFTCDVIATDLRTAGCNDYLVEVGREIVCKGESSRGGLWRIGLDKPVDGNFDEGKDLQTILEVSDCGIVTSGNYRKFYVEDGQKYAHTIDPRIGRPVQHHLLCATIITSDATDADAYATWAMVIGLEEAKKKVATIDGVSAYLVFDSNEGMSVWSNQ